MSEISPALARALAKGHAPFLMFVEGALKYSTGAKLYIWRKTEKKPEKNAAVQAEQPQVQLPKLSQSKLREISWGLDVHDTFEKRGDSGPSRR